ncbi:hypothetical protein ACS0TY_023520 [Phlomoides rotata]
MLSDLQVDVNGQQTFSVSLDLLASFSGKLRKMFGKSAPLHTGKLKLILHDFPGGAEGFELIVRFCYNGGRISYITPSNALLLHSAAMFLEINEDETKKFFENIPFLSWPQLLDCLKQSQELQPFFNSSYLVQEILNAVVDMISMANVTSPRAFSSSDSCTTDDLSTSFHNWLHDLEFLTVDLFEKVLSTMIARNLDHGTICSFLIHFQRAKSSGHLSSQKKCRIIKVVITSVSSIDGGFKYPFRRLCDVLQKCSSLKAGKSWAKKVEKMVGRRLDEATLDDLLVPCPKKNTCAYDVDLVLRLLKIFCRKSSCVDRLKKVGFLMDLYLAEVAPDPHLRFCKFLALALALPASARGSCDRVCEAIDMFFKVHGFVCEEEKMRICSVLNYEKLSSELLVKLAENIDFPDCVAADALVINLQSKLKSSLSANEDEEISVKLKKNPANVVRIDVLCPRSGKSLPILCS